MSCVHAFHQNKRQSDLDWEAGWSKKKLVTGQRSSGQEQVEQVQQETPQPRAEKPTFKAVGHIVMAMKRFQGTTDKSCVHSKCTPAAVTFIDGPHLSCPCSTTLAAVFAEV